MNQCFGDAPRDRENLAHGGTADGNSILPPEHSPTLAPRPGPYPPICGTTRNAVDFGGVIAVSPSASGHGPEGEGIVNQFSSDTPPGLDSNVDDEDDVIFDWLP